MESYPLTVHAYIQLALQEDMGEGDHTTLACVSPDLMGHGYIMAKSAGILSGIHEAALVFEMIHPLLNMEILGQEGDVLEEGQRVMNLSGPVSAILSAERVALNILQRMSGIATYTHRFTSAIHPLPVKILDTRKTTPLFRYFEKKAVRAGGGFNHRMGLFDMIMIKDNHIDYAGGIAKAIMRVQEYQEKSEKRLKVEIEARDLAEVEEIIHVGGVHRILLDNMSPEEVGVCVQKIGKRYETEVSGGIHLGNIREYAEALPDYISVGSLTHSAPAFDFSLKARI